MAERNRRPRDRRQRIQDAAAELFADRGFAGTGVGDIAKAVGITGGAIYRHFTSKDELLETIVLETVREFNAVARVEPAPGDERLRLLVTRSIGLTLSRSPRVATYLRERSRLRRPLKSELRKYERLLNSSWTEIMVSANPSLTPADALVRQAAVNGIFTSLAERRHTVKPARLESLIAPGVVAVVMARPSPSPPGVDPPAPAWTPPRSRRLEILDAAAALFRRHGYSGVGIDQIGEATGVAGPTIYGTFASKTEILAEVYDHVLARLDSANDAALAAAGSAADALEGILRGYVEVAFSFTDLLVVASREGRQLTDADRARAGRRRAAHRHLWAEVLGELRPELTEAEARTLVSATFTLVQRVALGRHDDQPTVRTATDLGLAFLLAGD